MKVTDFVQKDNVVTFSHYRAGNFYYEVMAVTGERFTFPIPLEELGEATLNNKEKAILVMRYIRKAIEDKTIIKKI